GPYGPERGRLTRTGRAGPSQPVNEAAVPPAPPAGQRGKRGGTAVPPGTAPGRRRPRGTAPRPTAKDPLPMSYPKASAGDSPGGVPPSPRFPQIEEAVLAYWDA